MARTDRSIGFLLLSGLLAAAAVFFLTRSWEATAISALAGLLATALLYDAIERRIALAITRPPAPAAGGASRDELATLLEALPHPCLIVHRGRIERCNHAALDLLGQHITGQDVRLALRQPAAIDLLAAPGGVREPVRLAIAGLGMADQNWELDIQPLDKDRNLVLLLDQSGRQATEQMRVDFVANASHELRTPLAGILGFIETLRDPVAGDDPATRARFLTIMDGEARRMQRLLDDLMSLSRIEADKYRAPEQPVAVPPLIEEVVAVFRQSQSDREMVIQIAPDVATVRGDRAQLSQLLHNLVSNALKYGAPGTPVTIAARRIDDDMTELSVTDRGDGIAPQHLPRLTERFYRIDSSRSRAMGGTGLGLAIVKHIVQRHGGTLHLESKVGVGTTIRVALRNIAVPDALPTHPAIKY
ncbi:MAG TPA: ATP-binding protein [Sphingobium sp.]|nr:ATP-binding protein [Sphingobium sp.]